MPLAGPRKIAVIQHADRMNDRAEHALLKMLEEPHPYAKLILTTHSLRTLLPTVISRCVTIPVELRELQESLTETARAIRDIARKVGTMDRAMARDIEDLDYRVLIVDTVIHHQ